MSGDGYVTYCRHGFLRGACNLCPDRGELEPIRGDDMTGDDVKDKPSVYVVLAANYQGRVDPFVFDREEDATRFAASVDGWGQIETVLVYGPVQVLGETEAQQAAFAIRGLKEVKS